MIKEKSNTERRFPIRQVSLQLLVALSVSLASTEPTSADDSSTSTLQRVDVNQNPWKAIGQVNNSAYGRCTGFLIGRRYVATAAHCLFNRRSGHFMRPQSIHFVLGYDRGAYSFQTVAHRFRIGKGYDPIRPIITLSSDWAILTLRDPAPATVDPLQVTPIVPSKGDNLTAVGFAQQRSHVLTKITPCAAEIDPRYKRELIRVKCEVPPGYSGGPLLDESNGVVVGIQVASSHRRDRGLTVAVRSNTWGIFFVP